MARRTRKRGARLALPWEREDSPFRSMLSGRRLWPVGLGASCVLLFVGAHWIGGLRADVRSTRVLLGEVQSATRAFVNDIGRCPHNAQELVHPPRSGVHYLSESPVDAWGRAVHLRCTLPASDAQQADLSAGKHPEIEVTSAGQNGSFFDEDNVL
jgi:hypothetical protein